MRDRLATFPIDTAIVQDMTQAKTVYTQDYFEEVLRADDKLMMLDNGLLVDYLQVEVSDATWFLKHDMVTYMQESMHRLHTEHHVLCLLHLHDITQRKTYLLSNYEHFLRYLHVNNFP